MDEAIETGAALDIPDQQDQNIDVAAAGRQRGAYMGFARALATFVFILALPVALVTSNIRILANTPAVYSYAFDRYNAEDSTGLSRADLDSTAAALRTYFNDGEPAFYHQVTEGGLSESVFNARETRHMQDVKRLFVWSDRAQEATTVYVLLYVVAFFVWSNEGEARQLAKQCLVALAVGAIAVGGIGIFAAFGFEAAFTRFHELLFTNDFWQLDPQTDHLIQMFPEGFWRDVTIMLGAMCAIEAALVGGVSAIYLLATRGERRHLAAPIDVSATRTQAA